MVEQSNRAAGARFERWFELEVVDPMSDFANPQQEWRRLFSELFGTFLLVIVAAGGGMMSQAFPETISRTAAVVAPGLMVMGIILFMGKVSGAHLNPVVTLAFASRGDFPWRRVPGYILVQLIGATLAAWLLQAIIGVSATYGSNYPGLDFSDYWVYVAGPLAGAGIAVLLAFVLRATAAAAAARPRLRATSARRSRVPGRRDSADASAQARPGRMPGGVVDAVGVAGVVDVRTGVSSGRFGSRPSPAVRPRSRRRTHGVACRASHSASPTRRSAASSPSCTACSSRASSAASGTPITRAAA